MEDKNTISHLLFESITTRFERTIERLWILCIILIVLLVGSNCAWLYYENQFEDVMVTQQVDTGEGDATVMGVGDMNYGESEADSTN